MIWKAVDDASLMDEANRLAAHFADAADGWARPDQAGARCVGNERSRPAARPRARPAGPGGPHAGLLEGVTAFFEKRPPKFTGRSLMDAPSSAHRRTRHRASLRAGHVGRGSGEPGPRHGRRAGRAGRGGLSMPIRPDMTNGHGICHGGFIFTLANSAFAFACNTYNQRTVAQQCAVTFLQPGRRGDTLTAHAVERNRSGRSGIYDVTVRNAQGEVVAEFRGHSRTIAGTLLARAPDTAAAQQERQDGRFPWPRSRFASFPNSSLSRQPSTASRWPRGTSSPRCSSSGSLDAAPRLRQRAALPGEVRRGGRASRTT